MKKEELKELIVLIDRLFKNCQIDYDELKQKDIDENFLNDYNAVRIINSFLFNYSKIQDKIGAKLFKKFLYVTNEIDDLSTPMIDILNILEQHSILKKDDWERLREIRNSIAHEYPYSIQERVENIYLALDGYEILKQIYKNIKARL
jgi:hypothetical protein